MFIASAESPGSALGSLLFLILAGGGINVLFGFWGKSRADDYGVEPWIGFLAGFFLGFIGVLIVPILKTHRIVNVRRPAPPLGPPPGMPYPEPYGAPPAGQPQGVSYPQVYGSPPAGPPQQYAPPQPDADGYIPCPGCGSRTKATRRNCMACGAMLPQAS